MLSRGGLPLDALKIEPLSVRATVQETVYRRLSYAIMTGQFDPGQTLTIAYLADLFGTSNMPIREAMRRLTAENALETTPSGATKIPVATVEKLDDLCAARILIEGAATEMALPNIDPPLIRALEHNLADHVAAGVEGKIHTMLQKNQEFHFIIYRASRSPTLIQLIEALWLQFGPFLRMLSNYLEYNGGNSPGYTSHHRDIIRAIKNRDKKSMKNHVVFDIRATQQLLQVHWPDNTAISLGRRRAKRKDGRRPA
jgi:DNA-binding GntR family transcriptional regulator